MISWCAYCQTYQGECAPYDVYSITHGLCDRCLQSERYLDNAAVEAVKPLVAFYARLRSVASSGEAGDAESLMDEAEALGIRPLDFLVGMLQPALSELGELWAAGRVSVAQEHQFTLMVESVAASARQRLTRSISPRLSSSSPEFLLVNAEGNYHTLGLRLVELLLLSSGRSTRLVIPGLPAAEVLSLVRAARPKVVAVSACLAGDLGSLGAIGALLDELDPDERPRLVVGGHAVRMDSSRHLAFGADVCVDARRLASETGAAFTRSARR